MKLLSFGAKNFLGYRELELQLASLDSLVLIDGLNYDFAFASSNGAGKSTLAEAITYALFGKTIRGLESRHGKDAVVHAGAKGGATVWLEAELPSGKLRIERYRQHPEYENKIRVWLDGKDVVRGRDVHETDDRIEQLLGFNYDLFCRAVVIHSRLTESFSTVENRYIKSITERLLGLRDYDGLRKFTKDQVDKCEVVVAKTEANISNLAARIEELDSELKNLAEKQKQHTQQQAIMSQRLAQEIKACDDKIKYLGKDQGQAAQSAIDAADQRDQLGCERAKIKLASIETKGTKDKADRKIAELNTELRIATQVAERYNRMKGKNCPECNQVVSIAHVKAKIKELENHLAGLTKKLKTAQADVRAYTESVSQNDKQLEQLDTKLDAARARLITQQGKTDNLAEQLRTERAQLKRLQEQQEELAHDPYAELIAGVKALLIGKETERAKQAMELQSQEERKRYLNFWLWGFGPNGMRSFMLDGATPILNQLANSYLEQLTDNTMSLQLNTVKPNKDGVYKDKFDIDVTNESGSPMLGGDSDGEIGCVDLALSMAMGDMLESRIKGGIGLLFIDQALDLLDSTRAAKAIRLLRQKTDLAWCERQGLAVKDHVFIISHKTDVQDNLNSVLYVKKKNGVCALISA